MIKINKGLHIDNSELEQPLYTWRDAENLVIDDDKQTLRTEYGILDIAQNMPSSNVIGDIVYKDFAYYFFANGEVGKVNKINGYYTQIATGFTFNSDYPIKCKITTNAKEDIILIWTDEYNVLRFLNTSNPQSINDTNTRLMGHNTSTLPDHFTLSSVNGGSIPNGTYILFYRLITNQGQSTNWTISPNYLEVHAKGGSSAFKGSEAGESSGKSIKLSIPSNKLDTNFSFYEVGLICNISEVTSVKILGRYNTTNSAVTNVYTDLDNGYNIDITEVITPKANYPIVKDIELIEDQLLLGGLEGEEPVNYQRYANDIVINYTHSLDSVKSALSGNNQTRGFMPGEVYAFYIIFLMNDGSYSKAFHIPGRSGLAAEIASSTLVSGSLVYQTEDTADNGVSSSNMGYWENKDEIYPNTLDYLSYTGSNDLREQKVRHHRFPSLDHLRQTHYSVSSTFGKSHLPVLGIEVSNVVIPTEIAIQTKGYFIASVKRNIKDSIILGFSDFQCAGELTGTSGTVLKRTSGLGPLAGNIKLGQNGVTTEQIEISDQAIKFSNFDLLYNKPRINPNYIYNEYRVSVPVNSAYGYNIDENRRYLDITFAGATITTASSTDKVKLIDSAKYIPAHVITGDINNYMGDEHILVKADFGGGAGVMVDNDGNEDAWINNTVSTVEVDHHTPSASRPHKTYLTSLRQILDNVYSPFDKQLELELLGFDSTSTAGGATYSISINNGDIVNDNYFYMNTAPLADSPTGIIEAAPYDATADGNNYKGRGTLVKKVIPMPTVSRLSARVEDLSLDNSLLYPNTPTVATSNNGIFTMYDPTSECFRFYDKTYSFRNQFHGIIPYSTFEINTFRYKNRIHRSTDFNRLSTGFDISFPANNFYELQFTKGDFIGMIEFNGRLIIRHENTAFISVPRQKVALSGGEATIGNNDIFDLEPQELISTDNGFVGGSSKFSAIKTEYGVLLIDDLNGRIFLYASSLEEISKLGTENYFRNNFSIKYKYSKRNFTTVASEVSGGKQVLLFSYTTYNKRDFKIGEFIYSSTDDTTGLITDVKIGLSSSTLYIKVYTDIVSVTTSHANIAQYRRIDNPFTNGIIAGYDPELKRILITKKTTSEFLKNISYRGFFKSGMTVNTNDVVFKNGLVQWNGSSYVTATGDPEDEITLSFYPDPKYKFWCSKHDNKPNRYIIYKDELQYLYTTSTPNLIKRINVKSQTSAIPKIELIFNIQNEIAKSFAELRWKTLAYNLSDVLQVGETFDKLTMVNSQQSSGEINLTNYVNINTPNNIRSYNGVWKFNFIRDSSNNIMVDNYIRLIFRDTGSNLLYLYGFDLTFTPIQNI